LTVSEARLPNADRARVSQSPKGKVAIWDCWQHLNLRDAVKRGVDVVLSLMAATATALLLALIARDHVGMPPYMIREDALIAASIVFAAVAGVSWRRRKQ
jgi:hypothetical protein